jgi:hypothetical protein
VLPEIVTGAEAQEPPREPRLQIAPYLWIPSITGTVGTEGPSLIDRLEVDFTRFRESLRLGGAMVNLGWRSGPWVAYGDWTYANVRSEAPTSNGVLYDSVGVQVLGHIVQGFGGYTVLDRSGVRVDVAGGVRGYSLRSILTLGGGTLEGQEGSGKAIWADAVGAVRATARLGDRWEVYLHGDAGGGGSQVTWQLLGAAGYQLSWGKLFAGYRHLVVDYRDGAFILDIALSGPIFGASFAF